MVVLSCLMKEVLAATVEVLTVLTAEVLEVLSVLMEEVLVAPV